MDANSITNTSELSLQPRMSGEEKNIYPVEFHGKTGEYFKIWIVNTTLSIVTLWIYSAWAKVRKNRYLYGNTLIDNSAFDYTAEPMQILRGRMIALGLLIAYQLIINVWPTFGGFAFAALVILAPLFIVLSMRFRLRNTVWRNVRFHFDTASSVIRRAYILFLPPIIYFIFIAVLPFLLGADLVAWSEKMESQQEQQFLGGVVHMIGDLAVFLSQLVHYTEDASIWSQMFPQEIARYFVYLGVSVLLVMLLFPWWQAAYYRYIGSNSYYGDEKFSIEELTRKFYRMYIMLIVYGALIAGFFAVFAYAIQTRAVVFVVMAGFMFVYAYLFGFIQARRTNIVYGSLTIADVEVESRLNGFMMTWLYITNTLAILLTLGLAIPWATIRVARYRAECMQIRANDLGDFSAKQANYRSAVGEEVGDLFGLDLGI